MSSHKLKCSILGGTGIVGQNYIKLLRDHPWFEIIDIAASPRSEGKHYYEAVKSKWQMNCNIPEPVKNLIVRNVFDFNSLDPELDFVFSAIALPNKDDVKTLEFQYAQEGIPVISNNSANRWTPDVPMLIPEINHEHLKLIPIQQRRRNFSHGFVVVKPNCSIQSYIAPLHALEQAGYAVEKVIVTTLQAVSGAGYPGVASLDIIDNIVPYIGGEEEKSEMEPLKIFGTVTDKEIINRTDIHFSATCIRVPVTDGHTASVNFKFKGSIPKLDEIIDIWKDYRSLPQELRLPFAPENPIIYLENVDRPQPKKDRDNDKGMAVTIGRLRKDNILDYKFIALSHNTIRGAAGGAILNAELLKAKGFFEKR
ncbi:MAG: aspartate-semialdehyde dehydrogenase [Promethearchaeota archaeon]|nr:MAG: aspartate-semialdehyde dehydrogenase [Candidatus Lokiarchaeota archaeon]